MKYVVISLAGQQFMVKEGDVFQVTQQKELTNKTLFYSDGSDVRVGTPFIDDISVDLEKIEDKKDKKVIVARYRSKSRHRVRNGHRQPISVFKVKSIGEAKKTVKKPVKKEETE